jgi:hypothetical protein
MTLNVRETDRMLDIFIENAKALLDGRPMRNLMNKQLYY